MIESEFYFTFVFNHCEFIEQLKTSSSSFLFFSQRRATTLLIFIYLKIITTQQKNKKKWLFFLSSSQPRFVQISYFLPSWFFKLYCLFRNSSKTKKIFIMVRPHHLHHQVGLFFSLIFFFTSEHIKIIQHIEIKQQVSLVKKIKIEKYLYCHYLQRYNVIVCSFSFSLMF